MKIKFPVLISLLVLAIWIVYSRGLNGALYYDDEANLYSLIYVTDLSSLWQFITAGEAGPLGRPLALFTFALQAGQWPNPHAFLVVNVIIHIVNAILLLLISNLILSPQCGKSSIFKLNWISFTAVILWALLPLNVSTSLIVVQRMTSLSAMFGLFGVLIYILQFNLYKKRNVSVALAAQFATLGIIVSCASFAKESAVLIVVFVLVLEVTVLRSQSRVIPGYKYRLLLLSSGLVLLLFYLSPLNLDWTTYIQSREFSRIQRVNTELVLMWGYLKSAFLPIPSNFSPFHDDVSIIRDSLILAFAGIAWIATIFIFYLIRSKSIWPLFGILWFLTGHLLESTSVSLELMFEHRNYLALFGPCLAFVAISKDIPQYLQSGYKIIASVYTVFIIIVCFMTTSLWGDPKLAADVWSVTTPGSSRAVLHLVNFEPESTNVNFQGNVRTDRLNYKLNALDRTIASCPTCTAVKVQALLLACIGRTDEEIHARFLDTLNNADRARALRPLVDAIYPLIALTGANKCSGISLVETQALVKKVEQNPLTRDVYYGSKLAYQSAEISFRLGDVDRAELELYRAESIDPSAIPVLEFQIHLAIERGDFDEAIGAVERRRKYAGKGLFLTSKYLNEAISEIRNLRSSSR